MSINYDLNELKSIEINLFKEFIRVCNIHNLKWFVLGGTCLGAVRHKGFIPWDDDIDVGMPRHDYDLFLKLASNELPSGIFVQSIYSEKDYPHNFSKLRDSNTTFIETSMEKFNINHGVYIDIFPLDGYKKSWGFDFLNALYSRRIGYAFNFESGSVSFKNRIKRSLLMLLFPSLAKTVKKRDALLKRFDYNTSDLVANYCGAWGKKEIVSKSCFGEGTKGIFENIEICLPANYDLYLSCLYGDYMTLPPIEKRVAHHFTSVVDLNNPYIKYTKFEKTED